MRLENRKSVTGISARHNKYHKRFVRCNTIIVLVAKAMLVKNIQHQAMDDLIQSSIGNKLEWISYEEISNIEQTQINNVYHASCRIGDRASPITLLLLLG